MTMNDPFLDDIDTNSCCAGCDCNNCCNDCLCDLNNEWAQTTCCRCATAAQCEQPPPSAWDNDNQNDWQGCDLYAPDVFIGDAVESASAPGMWFTSVNQLEAFLEATVTVRPWLAR